MNDENITIQEIKFDKQLEEILSTVLIKVNEIYCFGSNNKGATKQTEEKFQLILKAITIIFDKPNQGVLKRILAEYALDDLEEILKQGSRVTKWKKPDVPAFKYEDKIIYLPLKSVTDIDSKLLGIIKTVYPPDKFNWNENLINNACATFAAYMRDRFDDERAEKLYSACKGNLMSNREYTDELRYKLLYDAASEPEGKKTRDTFFKQTLKDAKKNALFGIGNCGLLADLAFLEMIYQNLDCKISLIRFVCAENPKVEECNAVALGDWPKAGCIIINPWHGEKGKYYQWNGSFENTPEATQLLKLHNKILVLFESQPKSSERKRHRQFLIESGYASWLENSTRIENINLAKQHCENFKESLIKNGFIEEKELECSMTNTLSPF